MADFTNLPNAAVGVGGLPSGTTVTALRDNPLAIAEGADTAPRVLGSAIAYNALVDFEVVTPALQYVFTDLPPFQSFAIAASAACRFSVSNNNGATWSVITSVNTNTMVVFSMNGILFNLLGNGTFEVRGGTGPFNALRVQNTNASIDLPAGRSWRLYSMARGLQEL
jgi:hypothetical protein